MPSAGTILIVDDSADDMQLLLRTFHQLGIQNPVHTCSNGDDALHYLDTHDLPALLLLDLKMPGTDGFKVLSKVKSSPALRDLIVIVLTTSSDQHDIQLSYELGANSFLTKPFDLAEFRETVSAFHQYWVVRNRPAAARGKVIKNPSSTGELD